MPFPLENFDTEISEAYAQVDRILLKLKAATENPINQTPARKRKLKALQYKAKTCAHLIREIAVECNDLWF